MHLFIIDIPISFDLFAPIIYSLLKKKQKVLLVSIYPVHTYKKNQILKFLQNNGLEFNNISNFSIKYFFIYQLFRLFIFILPISVIVKRYGFWKKIYNNYSFLNKDLFLNYLIKNQVKSITIDESLPVHKQEILSSLAKKKNIPLIEIPTGLHTVKNPRKLTNENFKFADFILLPNDYLTKDELDEKNKKKLLILGSARYDYEWIGILDELNSKLQINKNKKKIGVFTRYSGNILTKNSDFIIKLSKSKDNEIKFKEKPRTILPEKCHLEEITSTQLINWSDIIISHSSSILIEAIMKNKKILFLNFVQPKEQGSRFINYNCVKVINSKEELYKELENDPQVLKKQVDSFDVEKILRDFIFKKKNQNILVNYAKFYEF